MLSQDSPKLLLVKESDSDHYQPHSPKLLDQVRTVMRRQHYAIRTEETYVQWIIRFIHFHNLRHPQDMDTPDIEAFLNHLAVKQQVSASTQNQAFSALLFLYKHVLQKPLSARVDALRAKTSPRLPTVLSQTEVQALLKALPGRHQLVARLLYGSGLRLMEALRLRVKDIDFEQHQIVVRAGKGDKDRTTILPDTLRQPLKQQLQEVKTLHQKDLVDGYGAVYLPYALERKYPHANREWGWQYVFPSHKLSKDPRSDRMGRHHGNLSRSFSKI